MAPKCPRCEHLLQMPRLLSRKLYSSLVSADKICQLHAIPENATPKCGTSEMNIRADRSVAFRHDTHGQDCTLDGETGGDPPVLWLTLKVSVPQHLK